MVKKLLVSALVLVGTAAVAQTVINWSTVNASLATIATDVKAQSPFLTKLDIVFDPASDLAQDKVGLSFTAATDQAAWAGKNAELKTGLNVSNMPSADSMQIINASLNADLITQTLPAIRHFMKDYIAKCKEPREVGQSISDLSDTLACDVLGTVDAAQKVREVRVAVENAVNTYLGAVEKMIADSQEKLKTETRPDEKLELERMIERATNEMNTVKKVGISGSGDSLVVEVPFTFNAGELVELNFRVELQNETANMALSLKTKVDQQTYDNYKQALTDALVALESQSPEALEAIRDMAVGYAEMVKEYITK